MRFLLRVDSHARNHSAHPQAQSRVAALRAYPCSGALRACSAAARSARVCLASALRACGVQLARSARVRVKP